MIFKEEMFEAILKEHENHKVNQKIRKAYTNASWSAEFHYNFTDYKDASKVFSREKYKNDFKGSYYNEEKFVKMMLTCEMMAIKLKLKDEFGEEFWQRFNAPTEVVCFNILRLIWNPELIDVNIKEPATDNCEIDLILRDINGRVLLLVDVQGRGHEEDKEKQKDEEKVLHFEEHGISYIQLTGKKIKNNYVGILAMFLKIFSIVFNEKGMAFLPEKLGVESLLEKLVLEEEYSETNNK